MARSAESQRRVDKGATRAMLLASAASWLSSEQYLTSRMEGPYDDAEMGLRDDELLDAARAYVTAWKGTKTANDLADEMRAGSRTSVSLPLDYDDDDDYCPMSG